MHASRHRSPHLASSRLTAGVCIIHLIRNTFRLASRRDWDALKHDVKPIYTAVNAEAARAALEELTEKWGPKYGAIIRLWNNAWEEFIPFLDYDVEIRTVLCSTNAIESERPIPPGGQGQRPLPDRASRHEMSLPGHQIPGPHRARQGTMDHAVESQGCVRLTVDPTSASVSYRSG